MKIYLVRNYTFYESNGKDYQVANCGDLPNVFTSKRKAEKYFYEQVESESGKEAFKYVDLFPYTHYTKKFMIGKTNYRRVYTLQEVEVY